MTSDIAHVGLVGEAEGQRLLTSWSEDHGFEFERRPEFGRVGDRRAEFRLVTRRGAEWDIDAKGATDENLINATFAVNTAQLHRYLEAEIATAYFISRVPVFASATVVEQIGTEWSSGFGGSSTPFTVVRYVDLFRVYAYAEPVYFLGVKK